MRYTYWLPTQDKYGVRAEFTTDEAIQKLGKLGETGMQDDSFENKVVKTLYIPIDEYFDLRTKAEMNAYLMERIGHFEQRLYETEGKLYNLEDKIKQMKGEGK
jgi:DNA polymerase III delta prime subunit